MCDDCIGGPGKSFNWCNPDVSSPEKVHTPSPAHPIGLENAAFALAPPKATCLMVPKIEMYGSKNRNVWF